MTKFTSGPWEVIGEWIREKGKPNLIGYASRDENADPPRSDSERQANANLIAAAPDMYAALHKLVHSLPTQEDWDAARAALAKAEAGSPS